METFKQLSKKVFQIHELGNSILSEKQIVQTLKFESLLYFNYIHQLTENPLELRNILQGMHKIAKSELTNFHYELDIINQNLKAISSKNQMDKVITEYNHLEKNLRMFDLENIFETNSESDFYNDRIRIYKATFQELEKTNRVKIPQVKNDLSHIELDGKKIDISKYQLPEYEVQQPSPRKGGNIKIMIADLKLAAKEMDAMIASKPNVDEQNYVDRMNKFDIYANDHYGIQSTDQILLKEVCHIIGMVGTGKSTLIHVLVYYLSKNGYKTMVLFETVKDVLTHADLFDNLGVLSTAINGERKQEKRVQKVIEYQEMIIPEKYASNLTGNCYISQLSGGVYDDLKLYGEEPCYRMTYEGKATLCPFYSICPRKQNSRKLYNASAIFANINSLLYNRTGLIKGRGRLLLLEYVIDFVDVVIFDEADELQMKLDHLLNESEYTETILNNSFNELYNYIKIAISNGDFSEYRDLDANFRIVLNGLTEVKNLLKKRSVLEGFKQIKYGQWFSSFILAKSIDFLPNGFAQDYNRILENKDESFFGMQEAYLMGSQKLDARYKELYEQYRIEKKDYFAVRFLIALVLTEKYILSLQTELEKIQKNNNTIQTTGIPNIFKRPNKDLMRLLPSSPTNNRFGFIYDEEGNTLQIFRQQAIGRSAMTDLPYLKVDKNGKPLGPHTILLSGSSFAPGSSAHHIHRPVKYILQAPDNIQQFIKQINIKYVNTNIKISGAKNKKAALKEICHANKELFMNALNEDGRSLIIVNSYEQAQWVQNELKQILPTKVYRLIPDSSIVTNETIQRSKLNQSKNIAYKFLIAPAIAIARGFNIVDEKGHSLFKKMFVLVRPMSKPKEIETIVSIVNGEVTRIRSMQLVSPFLSVELERIKNCRNSAQMIWNKTLRDFYGIQNADELLKRNIIVSRLILLTQLIGRLLRVTNLKAAPPEINLLDHAFVGRKQNDFDLLEEIERYLEDIMVSPRDGVLVEKLYSPFLEGLKRGKSLV
ncbi:hypothetical protein MHB44_07140 [Lysinibacillus sp. FSL H8-0500]|uniref:hypothetical protein n=1 Tax=Lysinibacillus sp. FSL H8-0500 TaxID=2921393 RepID=UPI00310163C0